jgi:hypothetical protein
MNTRAAFERPGDGMMVLSAINGQGAGGDGRDVHWFVVQVHQDALAELFTQY